MRGPILLQQKRRKRKASHLRQQQMMMKKKMTVMQIYMSWLFLLKGFEGLQRRKAKNGGIDILLQRRTTRMKKHKRVQLSAMNVERKDMSELTIPT